MIEMESARVFASALTEEEWSQIPSEISKKIEVFVVEKFDELLTARALSETNKFTSEQALSELQTKFEEIYESHEEFKAKLESSEKTIQELESQLFISVEDVAKYQSQCTILEQEMADFRRQRNAAVDEKEDLLKMVERRNAEVERMKADMTSLSRQLEAAISAKCEALAMADEVESKKLNLDYREKRIEQERTLMNNQIHSLTQDLNARTEELLNMRRDNTSRCIQLETKLTEKIQELACANENIKCLTDLNNNMSVKAEELVKKLAAEKEAMSKTKESFEHEMEAQVKLMNLYKSMSEEKESVVGQLTSAVSEIKAKYDEAIERYGDLETKFKETEIAHEEIIDKKNECIAMLKKELETANQMLNIVKQDQVDKDIAELCPTAASIPRSSKAGTLTMSQMMIQVSNLNDELAEKNEELSKLKNYVNHIIQQLDEKAPLLAQQRRDYNAALDNITELTRHNDELIMENQQLREETSEARRSEKTMVRENERFKREITDLSRQVCHLLKEVDNSRIANCSTSSNDNLSDSICSADNIITKKLVTFSDIAELQSNNQRLLALVRELSSKQEEAESFDPAAIAKLTNKLEMMREEHAELLEQQERQAKMVNMIIGQRDMYKSLYTNAAKGNGEDVSMPLDKTFENHDQSTSSKENDDSDQQNIERLQELETKLEKANKEIKLLQEENHTYKKERTESEQILVKQVEKMRSELQELTRQNSRLTFKCESNDELFKVLKNNTETYKNQIDKLEQRNKIYSESIVKHETTVAYLKDQILESQTKLSKAEVMLGDLQKENALLRDSESRLQKEREMHNSEKHSHSVLHQNIELIKATLDRKDAESRIRLEEQLHDANRECAAVRRRLQEEQDRFRQLSEHLEKQAQTATTRMEEEKQQADKLRKELEDLREDLIAKTRQMEELSKKLKTSMLAGTENNPESRKYRELEKIYEEAQAEIQALQQKLKTSKEAVAQHCNVAEAAEKQLQELLEKHKNYQSTAETKISEQEKLITELKEKCSELEGELSIQTDGQEVNQMGLKSKIQKLETFNKSNLEDLKDTQKQLESARDEIRNLSERLETTEAKYCREMSLHSADLQALAAVKEDLNKLLSEINEIKSQRDCAIESLEEHKAGWEAREKLFEKEKIEIEKRFKDSDKQNSLLLDQLHILNTQLSVIQAQHVSEMQNTSLPDTSFNRSLTEEDGRSSEQLLKIIKYLRQEKDIAVGKSEILEAEHSRIKAQQELITKQLEEAKAALEGERQKSEVSIITAAKHAEVLRKVETLNAITDSNRSLRLERDTLRSEVNELRARTQSLEEQLAPIQDQYRELNIKTEAVQSENITLRAEVTRWRQRANMLIEKSNRTSPEDWKKLQNERENLAKQLTIERGNTASLNDSLNTTRQEKSRLEDQLKQVRNQMNTQKQELDHLTEELGSLRAQVMNLNQDLDQAKIAFNTLNDEHSMLQNETEKKDTSLNDLKNNLVQIRKIAKKYKTQCEDQMKEIETLKKQILDQSEVENITDERQEQLRQEGRSEVEERISQLEQTHNEQVSELNQQVSSATEENENCRKEIEAVKQLSLDKEERFKALFKNAKDRIMTLQEQVNSLKAELTQGRSSSNEGQEGGSSQESNNQSRAEIERLQKEKQEILDEKQGEKEKLNAEIEALNQKVQQLQRQLGLQQGAKPSTSSGPTEREKSSVEPPTANIKPMAGHSTNTQTQSVTIQPWRSGGEPPLASIRPMSMQIRTVAVPPTSQSPSAVMVPPQQQVHTTGSSNVEAMSSSPTSSHTDYAPATSSASSALLGPRQVAVPPTQSSQDTEDDDANGQGQPASQQQAVALVLPRVEPPSSGLTQEQGTSSTSSSNTVTTTQAGMKRPREADSESQVEEQPRNQNQPKRTRVQQGGIEGFQSVSESGLEVEYQVPTSSQRDHEEGPDVILVESDEEGDVPDEGEGADDEPDDADTEGYDEGIVSYPEQEMNYEDEQDANMGNEVEVIEDSSEVPNQSERSMQEGSLSQEENQEQAQSEAISSGTDGNSGVTVSQASTSVAVTMPSFSRTRQVAPLSRNQQSHLLLPHGLDEGGDDGIVPSTPTLFVPRRSDGFGEAVSSPHVPTSGRFTFNESGNQSTMGSNEVVPEQTLEMPIDDNSTGRSVPSTPLQVSPQECAPTSEDQASQIVHSEDIPTITVSGVSDEAEPAPEGSSGEMGPPSVAGTSSETVEPMEQPDEIMESEDGVTSEGEKPPSTEEGEEEGREAEASPSTNTRSSHRRGGTVARRSMRQPHSRGGMQRQNPTPIIWGGDHRTSPRQDMMRGSRGPGQGNFSPRAARRSRGRNLRPFGRY